MANPFDLLKYAAGVEGSNALKITDGDTTWGEIINSAGNSKVVNFSDYSGAAAGSAQTVGGWVPDDATAQAISSQAINGATYTEAQQAITRATYDATAGSAVIAGGGATGAALTGITLQSAMLSGLAALGGVAAGVYAYKDNPEFWTALSKALLPFAYGESYKNTGNYLQDAMQALIPDLIGADGTNYLPADFLNALAQALLAGNAFNVSSVIPADNPLSAPSFSFAQLSKVTYKVTDGRTMTLTPHSANTLPVYVGVGVNPSGGIEFFAAAANSTQKLQFVLNNADGSFSASGTYSIDFGNKKYNNKTAFYTWFTNIASAVSGCPSTNTTLTNPSVTDPIAWLMVYGNYPAAGSINGITPASGATIPQVNVPISTTYPNWWAKALQALNPASTPNAPTYKIYLPTAPNNAPQAAPAPDALNTTATQPDAQTGIVPANQAVPDALSEAAKNLAEGLENLKKLLTAQGADPGDNTPPDTDTGSTPVLVPPLTAGTANALFTVHNPTLAQVQAFGAWLWSSDIITQLVAMVTNPINAVIGLHLLYATPPTSGSSNIKAGYLDSGVSAAVVSDQYTTIDCGSVAVPEYYNNALDYDYTQVSIYLPFIGIVPLKTADVMGSTLSVKYRVDVLTGTTLAQLTVTRNGSTATLYTYSGNCAVQLPLTAGNYGTLLTGLLSAVGGAAATIASGGAALPAVAGVSSAVMGGRTNVQKSGNLGSNAGAMGIRIPYIIITRPVPYNALNYPTYYGYPSNKTMQLSNVTGYTRVKHIFNAIMQATDAEKDEIRSLLTEAVLL